MSNKQLSNVSPETEKIVNDIKRRHTHIAAETKLLEADKNKLKDQSLDIFLNDIGEGVIHGNHDYSTTDTSEPEIVRVNFKVKGRPMNKIGEKSAVEVIQPLFSDSYEKLFREQEHVTVTADQETILEQASERPELFRITLKQDLSSEQLKSIVTMIPQHLQVSIANDSEYAKVFPGSVEKKTSVSVKNGFLDSLSKVDKIVLDRAKGFIKGFFKKDEKSGTVATLQPSVICGNRGK